MTETYTTAADGEVNLLRMYSRQAMIEPLERQQTGFWKEMKAVPNSKPGGSGLFFRVVGAKGHGVGAPGETGDFSTSHTRAETLCRVQSAQLDSVVSISMKYEAAAEGAGSFTGDADEDLVVEATASLFTWVDELTGAGFGTGELASVNANVVADNVVVCALPEGVYQLRDNQPVDFVDASDVVIAQAVIVAGGIDYQAQSITLDQNVTVTAGNRIFQRDTVGSTFPNGLRSIIDDGTNAASIYGKARTDFPYLNGSIVDHGLQDYSEEAVDKLLTQITYTQDMIPTQLRSNIGIAMEHKARMTSDRTFIQPGDTPPKYVAGSDFIENGAYVFGTVKIPWKVDRNLPARSLFAVTMPTWGRNILREADWVTFGNGRKFLPKPAAGGDTWSYAYVGSLMIDVNIRSTNHKANGALLRIKDRFSAGLEDS